MATKFDIDKFNKAVTEGEIDTPLVSIPTPTPPSIGGTAPPGTETIGPTPPPDYKPPIGPIAPTPPPVIDPQHLMPIGQPPITSTPLPYIPISTTPLPSISTPTLPKTQRLPDIAPTPQFKETDQGTIITNLAEVKAYNRQYNDAVDALAPYKQGNTYNVLR